MSSPATTVVVTPARTDSGGRPDSQTSPAASSGLQRQQAPPDDQQQLCHSPVQPISKSCTPPILRSPATKPAPPPAPKSQTGLQGVELPPHYVEQQQQLARQGQLAEQARSPRSDRRAVPPAGLTRQDGQHARSPPGAQQAAARQPLPRASRPGSCPPIVLPPVRLGPPPPPVHSPRAVPSSVPNGHPSGGQHAQQRKQPPFREPRFRPLPPVPVGGGLLQASASDPAAALHAMPGFRPAGQQPWPGLTDGVGGFVLAAGSLPTAEIPTVPHYSSGVQLGGKKLALTLLLCKLRLSCGSVSLLPTQATPACLLRRRPVRHASSLRPAGGGCDASRSCTRSLRPVPRWSRDNFRPRPATARDGRWRTAAVLVRRRVPIRGLSAAPAWDAPRVGAHVARALQRQQECWPSSRMWHLPCHSNSRVGRRPAYAAQQPRRGPNAADCRTLIMCRTHQSLIRRNSYGMVEQRGQALQSCVRQRQHCDHVVH